MQLFAAVYGRCHGFVFCVILGTGTFVRGCKHFATYRQRSLAANRVAAVYNTISNILLGLLSAHTSELCLVKVAQPFRAVELLLSDAVQTYELAAHLVRR